MHENAKIVEVWLTKSEKNDPALQEKLKPFYQYYKSKTYTVAVFQSGTQELKSSMLELLNYNKRRSAEMEVAREKARRTAVMER